MGRVAPIQNSFIGGILARSMRGRADTEKYHHSAEDILNMYITPHGGAFRRPGTYLAARAKYDDKKARLIEFEFNTIQAYIIELGNGYMRFFRNGGAIADATNYVINGTFNTDVSSWDDISTGTGTMTWDGAGAMQLTADSTPANAAIGEQAITFVTADCKTLIQFDSVGADVEINIGTATGLSDIYASGALAAGTHNIEFTPAVTTTYLQFKWAGGTGTREVDNVIVNRDVYEISTPYLEAELSDVQFAQSADVMFMVYGTRKVQTLSRFGHDNWTMANYAFNEGPYTPTNYTRSKTFELTGTPWTKGSSLTLTAVGHKPFFGAMEDDTFRMESEADNIIYAWGTITDLIHTVEATVTVGTNPRDVAFDGTHIWVTNDGTNNVSKIDIATDTVVATVTVGTGPRGVAFDGTHIWVSNYTDGTISKIDITTDTVVATVTVGTGPRGVAFDGTHIWVSNYTDGTISKIDITTDTVVATVTVGTNPWGVAFDGTHIWVANFTTNNVSKIDIATDTVVATVTVGTAPIGVAFDGTHIWVANTSTNNVSKIDIATDTVVATVTVGTAPRNIAFDGTHIWVANYTTNNVSKIDIATDTVTIEAGDDVPTELQTTTSFKWNMAAFTAALGYPSVVNLAGQRLFFGRTATYPQTFWGSVPVALDTFTHGIDPDHSLLFTLASRKPHTLQWLAAAGKKLLAGTQGGEWSIAGSNDIISPTTLHVDPESSRGNAAVQPIEAGRALLAVQKYGKKLREIKYSFEADGYVSTDLTIMAKHLGTDSSFIDLTYQPDENSIVWVIRADGQMVACTYEPDHNVVAWHRHTTAGLIESSASIPGEVEDELWMIVKRVINGVTRRFIEQTQPTSYSGIENAFFVDCGLSYVGELLPVSAASVADPCVVRIDAALLGVAPAVDNTLTFADVEGMIELNDNKYDITAVSLVSGTIYDVTLELDSTEFTVYTSGGTAQYGAKILTGLDHLEGETVDILADGSPDAGVISGGSVTLTRGAAVIHVGLNYISQLRLLPPDAGAQNGTSLGKLKRYNELRVLFLETIGCKINDSVVPFQTLNAEMGKPLDLFTGYKRVENLGWDREGTVLIEQDQPLPMNVLAVTGTLVTNDS